MFLNQNLFFSKILTKGPTAQFSTWIISRVSWSITANSPWTIQTALPQPRWPSRQLRDPSLPLPVAAPLVQQLRGSKRLSATDFRFTVELITATFHFNNRHLIFKLNLFYFFKIKFLDQSNVN